MDALLEFNELQTLPEKITLDKWTKHQSQADKKGGVYGSRFTAIMPTASGPPRSIRSDVVVAKKNSALELYGENNESVEMKEVSTIALAEATVALVLSSHTSPNGRVSNNDKTLAKYNPFQTRAHKIGKDSLTMDAIRINIQGSLPPNFFDWVTAYGLDLHPDSKQYASHTSGGHSALRTMVNLMAAAHWTELLTMCLSLTDGH